jgi:hypothetical protein
MGWHPRGLFNPRDRKWVMDAMTYYGLDVILEIPELPIPSQPNQRYWYLSNKYSGFWQDYDWNLIKINLTPGPLWIYFIASNFDMKDNHYHISLCYRKELWEWWEYLKWDMDTMDDWITQYNIMQQRYNGKRARLRGKITGGYTLQLNGETRVEKLDKPFILWDGSSGYSCWAEGANVREDESEITEGDQAVRYVHMLPGNNFRAILRDEVQDCVTQNQARAPGEPERQPWKSGDYKSLQHMHVSMLMGD